MDPCVASFAHRAGGRSHLFLILWMGFQMVLLISSLAQFRLCSVLMREVDSFSLILELVDGEAAPAATTSREVADKASYGRWWVWDVLHARACMGRKSTEHLRRHDGQDVGDVFIQRDLPTSRGGVVSASDSQSDSDANKGQNTPNLESTNTPRNSKHTQPAKHDRDHSQL
eukprot:2564802-Amphidinium_carterae.1